MERRDKVSSLSQKMQLEKAVMGKGSKRKLKVKGEDGEVQTVFKWKKQRQR